MNKAAFKLEGWFLAELLKRLNKERIKSVERNETITRSILAKKGKAFNDNPFSEDTIPNRETLEVLIQNAFWASRQREESQLIRFKIGYTKPLYDYEYVLVFEEPLLFEIRRIAKLAPAVKERVVLSAT